MLENIGMITKELPMNFGPLKGANANARITGPCGDTMEFWLKIENNNIVAATFTTDGCENSIVCGSTAGYMLPNKNLDEAYAISQEQVLREIGYLSDEFKHCALLAVNTIKKALEDYEVNYQSTCQDKTSCDSHCGSCANGSCNVSIDANSNQKPKVGKQNQKQR